MRPDAAEPSVKNRELAKRAAGYYSARFAEHGPTARGVDWNGEAAQTLRFDQLLRVAPATGSFSLIDYGCGYGALLGHLRQSGRDVDYVGFDLSETMIEHARSAFAEDGRACFTNREADLEPADHVVASGVFNVRQDASADAWSDYVLDSLARLDALGSRGFAFNLLTSWSDPDRMREDLWYAEPGRILEHCGRHFSRHVALFHDYGLYEFTVIVRKP